jgi:hypothetical protein
LSFRVSAKVEKRAKTKAQPCNRPGRKEQLSMSSNVGPLGPTDQVISILKIKRCPKADSAAKAFATIQYHDETIHDCVILQQRDGQYVVLFPASKSNNGYRNPIVEFSEPTRSLVEKLILDAANQAGFL